MNIMRLIRSSFLLLCSFMTCIMPFPSFSQDHPNMAFKKNVPQELRTKYPLCDEFLDVNWIDAKRYIGKLKYNQYVGNEDKGMVHCVVLSKEWQYRGIGTPFRSFSISREEYASKNFEQILKLSEINYGRGGYSLTEKVTNKRLQYGGGFYPLLPRVKNHQPVSFTNFTKNVCLLHPVVDGVFVVEYKAPFRDQLKGELRIRYDIMIKEASEHCEQIAKEKRGYRCDLSDLPYAMSIDVNFDGTTDYISTVFLYQEDENRSYAKGIPKWFVYYSKNGDFVFSFIPDKCSPSQFSVPGNKKVFYYGDCNLTELTKERK
jgi:hypothetical protein